jgi:hypothetical protein
VIEVVKEGKTTDGYLVQVVLANAHDYFFQYEFQVWSTAPDGYKTISKGIRNRAQAIRDYHFIVTD